MNWELLKAVMGGGVSSLIGQIAEFKIVRQDGSDIVLEVMLTTGKRYRITVETIPDPGEEQHHA